jgi:hypothetical protein
MALLTVPAGMLIVALVWNVVSRLSRIPEKLDRPDQLAMQRRVYLVIAAVVQFLVWPAALENAGLAGYLIRIVGAALTVAPFLAGRDSRGDKGLACLWFVAILANLGLGLAAGSRAKALIVMVLFAAGYVSAIPRGRRLAVGTCAALAILPLLQFAGAAGVVRDRLGRGGLELVSSEHIREVFDELRLEMFGNQNAQEINLQGVGRMLAWTNVVVPLMTPAAIPYRGLDGFLGEATQTFRIASLSGLTSDDLLDAGLNSEPARLYGFTIDAFTAVEFTLVADAWSRGGASVALLFSVIAALVMTAAELCVRRLHRYGKPIATILALPVAKAAFFDANIFPLLTTLRVMLLNLLVIAVVVVAVEAIRLTSRGLRHDKPRPHRLNMTHNLVKIK